MQPAGVLWLLMFDGVRSTTSKTFESIQTRLKPWLDSDFPPLVAILLSCKRRILKGMERLPGGSAPCGTGQAENGSRGEAAKLPNS